MANKRRNICYPRIVPELRTCSVSYKDMEGVTNTVEITASSLYEAAVLEMKAFEQSRWGRPPGGLHGDHGEVPDHQASSASRPGHELA